MARLELSQAAVEDLDRLIRSHSLPSDTRERFSRSVASLGPFPFLGSGLSGRWSGLRFVLGPWRWMAVVYEYLEEEDRVVILTIQDGRSSTFAG